MWVTLLCLLRDSPFLNVTSLLDCHAAAIRQTVSTPTSVEALRVEGSVHCCRNPTLAEVQTCHVMQAWRRTAQSVEALALSLEREVPDTAATMRLSGLELADAIGEVTLLGADLTEVRTTSADRAYLDACASLSASQKR